MFYPLKDELIESCGLPARFTNPFDYRPHPLVVEATKILRLHLDKHAEWSHEISRGKMFGVLIVRSTYGEVGFLAAFSGNLDNKTVLEGFVPPIFNLKASDSFFWHEEGEITRINTRLKELQANTSYLKLTAEKEQLRGTTTTQIAEYRAKIKLDKEGRREEREGGCSPERQAQLNRESQYQKAELKRLEARHAANLEDIDNLLKEYVDEINDLKYMRKKLSIELQRKIFDHYNILNHKAQSITLTQLFSQTLNTLPPAGAGECAAPKLLNYAFQNNMEIIAMGEFWQGASPKGEVRHHNSFYPACNSKCRPILGYMLGGMALDTLTVAPQVTRPTKIIYQDSWLAVVDKPSGLPCVKGTSGHPSVEELLPTLLPSHPQSKVAHRLDMDTSGLLIIAFTPEVHAKLQRQFSERTIKKRYVALLDGVVSNDVGEVNLPLSPDVEDLPRQMVDHTHGKESITRYEVVSQEQLTTRINLYPLTGRTHQLRVHCSHSEGLNAPILGDRLYGREPQHRLMLHAEEVTFVHPITQQEVNVVSKAEF